ncbi:hypothetical protein NLG97_g2945 [Lecanicillium saksenae]|uniref:Uncharacterized protein n=1 Tax=Lecanicillium saksenae TaxID=468837 RepID=A0ACC1R0W2_9HYPO|nr:hypothetical protein NLG97_g2945 [Lecanicillium saksenae]
MALLRCALLASIITTSLTAGIPRAANIIGEVTDIKDLPYNAALLDATSGKIFCGGSILNADWILTAAQCIDSLQAADIIVRAGVTDFTDTDGLGQTRSVTKIVPHDEYDPDGFENDIAVLRLNDSLIFGSNIANVTLDTVRNYDGKTFVASGWGWNGPEHKVSKDLRSTNQTYFDHSKCYAIYSDNYDLSITSKELCAMKEGFGVCTGDNGGPLYDQSSKTQVGILSFGDPHCSPDIPAVFTMVSVYRDWVYENIEAPLV